MRVKTTLKLIGLAILAATSRLLDQMANRYQPDQYQPCDAYQLLYGNPTTKTTMWFIGEYHDRKDESLRCMEQLTANMGDHIVYFEMTAPLFFDCSMKEVATREGRYCGSWDDVSANSIIWNHNYGDCNIDLLVQGLKITGYSEDKYDQFLKTELSRQNMPLTLQCALLFLMREKGFSYKEIQSKIPRNNRSMKYLLEEDAEIMRQAHIERNKSLLRNAMQGYQGFFKIMIAGRSHLEAEPQNKYLPIRDGAGADYTEEQLRQLPDQNSYAVLVPKRKLFK